MRSKPNPVDQPERTAHYDCAMCIAEMLHNTIAQTETVLLIFPFLQTNITVQMRPSGGERIQRQSRQLQYCFVSSGIADWSGTDNSHRQTDRQTDTETDTQCDDHRHKHTNTAVDSVNNIIKFGEYRTEGENTALARVDRHHHRAASPAERQ